MEYFRTAAALTQKDDVASTFLGNKFYLILLVIISTNFQFLKIMVSNHCVYFFIEIKIHFYYVRYFVEISLRIMLMPREQVP